jgi:hypothetical protein
MLRFPALSPPSRDRGPADKWGDRPDASSTDEFGFGRRPDDRIFAVQELRLLRTRGSPPFAILPYY